MYEVELKLRADHDTVRSRLLELDAEQTDTVTQTDTYYDAPHRDFGETDEALRIREETDSDSAQTTAHLTYKGPLVDDSSKTREEIETPIDSQEMADILASLGFSPAATVTKEREQYELDEYTITLDSVTDLGEYVEVERVSDDIEAARDGAFSIVESLGLSPDDQLRTSYLVLLDNNRK